MGDKMKVFYIFQIKKEFVSLYKETPSILFNILRSIYYLDKEEVEYGYHLFKQLIVPMDKKEIDKRIFLRYHQDIPYIKRGDIHILNNLYKDEVSRLVINHYYMKLEIEQDFSSFYPYLKEEYQNLFACSFKNIDFFFLEK